MLIVKGVQRQTGTFQEKQYDNILLHCLNNNPANPTICGDTCETVKVKTSQVYEVFGGLVSTDQDFRGLMDQGIMVYYDRFQRAMKIDILEKGGTG